jgi:hypothetical protein
MKNSNDTIGNRTRNLPACSAVPQPTASQCAPQQANICLIHFLARLSWKTVLLYHRCFLSLFSIMPLGRNKKPGSLKMNGIYTGDVNLLRENNNITVKRDNVTMTHILAIIVAVEKSIIITGFESLFLALGTQHAMRMRHIVICGLPNSNNIFPREFRKK